MIKSKQDYKNYIKYEEKNYKKSYPNFNKELKKILKFQKLYRKLEYYTNCKKGIINNIVKKILQYKFEKKSLQYGFHIPINTIEKGLCIIHIGPIYINENSHIGENFRIHPMTTIGKNIGRNQASPKIGNNVWIGPGARLYGDINIGNNTVIGTNSVVNKSFPKNTTIAGAPAKIINNKGYKDYFK
ncbi:MAG: serine acetyltransferase [Bacilli bacterium]|nr:serine acetyltransferase [Bacilli bacterium]